MMRRPQSVSLEQKIPLLDQRSGWDLRAGLNQGLDLKAHLVNSRGDHKKKTGGLRKSLRKKTKN